LAGLSLPFRPCHPAAPRPASRVASATPPLSCHDRPAVAALVAACLVACLLGGGCGEPVRDGDHLTDDELAGAEQVADLRFDAGERELMRDDLVERRDDYSALHDALPDNAIPPAVLFDPLAHRPDVTPAALAAVAGSGAPIWSDPGPVQRPVELAELAFADLGELSELLRTGVVTSEELTRLSLDRLRRYGPTLECVITLTPERALEHARRADRELAAGRWRGPLHGIPYGAKDLLAVPGYPTTWGAAPYRDQTRPELATVIARLDAAGAVLVAKLTLGALAWGDVWFGGKTRNPWNLEQGSSGSSAGSAAAVSAGLVPFALGTETWGSIVSPCTRCGVTGLRPTFGRVSRAGAMALSWSMDKIGPIARRVEDCAVVFDAIRGADPADPTAVDAPFPYRPDRDVTRLRVGFLQADFAEEHPGGELQNAALDVLRGLDVDLIPVTLPGPDPYPTAFVLSVEAAAAFQELTLSGRDDLLVRQERYAWPNVFRWAQLVPAVEYVQANRRRWLLMRAMDEMFAEIDVYVTPSFEGNNLLLTNLTGHPQVVVPCGFREDGTPHSLSFVGRLYDEATVLAVARAYQEATDWHRRHPPDFGGR
jgi:Asp-tRNA(Asn)/Glu-tRNA(Gln) amidotransferase A subunit family amidase